MPQIARVSVPDQVFRRLVAGVLCGRYAPGERLPPQRALARLCRGRDGRDRTLNSGVLRLDPGRDGRR